MQTPKGVNVCKNVKKALRNHRYDDIIRGNYKMLLCFEKGLIEHENR